MLQNSGIDFQKMKKKGIPPVYFAEKVTSSGLVLNERINWICFHGCYDFAYLLKLMMNDNLPHDRQLFNTFMKAFFPNVYDIKAFQTEFPDILEGGGLNRIAASLDI